MYTYTNVIKVTLGSTDDLEPRRILFKESYGQQLSCN